MRTKDLRQQPPEALDAQVIRGSLIKHPAVFGPESGENKVQGLYQFIIRQVTRNPSFFSHKKLEVIENILVI